VLVGVVVGVLVVVGVMVGVGVGVSVTVGVGVGVLVTVGVGVVVAPGVGVTVGVTVMVGVGVGVGQTCEQASVYGVAKPLCGLYGLKQTTSLILPPLTKVPQQSVYEQSILSTVPETQQG
jgi:hypothetical protein